MKLSNNSRVSYPDCSDEKDPSIDQTLTLSSSYSDSNDYGHEEFLDQDIASNCVEAGCTVKSNFEKGDRAFSCRHRQNRNKRRSVLLRFLAVLAAVGLCVWNFVPKHIALCSKPAVELSQSVCKGSLNDQLCDDLKAFAQTYRFEEVKAFSLRKLIESKGSHGWFRNSFIQILPAENQKEDIIVDFSFESSNPQLQRLLHVDQTENSLVIKFPISKLEPQPVYGGWIETQTKVYVRSGLRLEDFELESRVLRIVVPSPIKLWSEHARLTTSVGSIKANPFFDSRHTVIRGGTGSVSGSYPLYDVLDIGTETGSISANVFPKAANKDDVQPASLIVNSRTGSIRVDYTTEDITAEKFPDRKYKVALKSVSGHIGGSFVHGTYTLLESGTGSISARLLPFAADRYGSELTTVSRTGTVSITVLKPYHDSRKSLKRLDSKHQSEHGSVNVRYPNSWEGTVEATTRTGSVSVLGPGLHIIKESRGVLGKFIEAKKGDGEGNTLCKSQTGSVKFTVDEV